MAEFIIKEMVVGGFTVNGVFTEDGKAFVGRVENGRIEPIESKFGGFIAAPDGWEANIERDISANRFLDDARGVEIVDEDEE